MLYTLLRVILLGLTVVNQAKQKRTVVPKAPPSGVLKLVVVVVMGTERIQNLWGGKPGQASSSFLVDRNNVHALSLEGAERHRGFSSAQLHRSDSTKSDGNLGITEKAVSAAGAAFFSAIIVNPLDVAKTRLQAQAAGVPYSHPLSNIISRMAYFGPTMTLWSHGMDNKTVLFKAEQPFLQQADSTCEFKVEGIEVHANEGGLTKTRGGAYWLILPAGFDKIVGANPEEIRKRIDGFVQSFRTDVA